MPFTYKEIPENETENQKYKREHLEMRVRADYEDMVKQALDAIPMQKQGDFSAAIIDLEKILKCTKETSKLVFDSQLKESMETVYEFYMQRDYHTQDEVRYVELPENDAEYREIIVDQIRQKINAFYSFTPDQKYQYIVNQKNLRNKTAQYQQTIIEGESKREESEKRLIEESGTGSLLLLLESLRLSLEQISIEQQIFQRIENRIRNQSFMGSPHWLSRRIAISTRLSELPQSGTLHHIVDQLFFKIIGRMLCVVLDGDVINQIYLEPEHIQLIRDNVNNIHELKNIFTNITTGERAQEILESIVNSEEVGRIIALREQRSVEQQTSLQSRLFHVIGNLHFKIDEMRPIISVDDGIITHELTVFLNDQQEDNIWLPQQSVDIITENINNIGALKEIFGNRIGSNNLIASCISLCLASEERRVIAQETNQQIYNNDHGQFFSAFQTRLSLEQSHILSLTDAFDRMPISIIDSYDVIGYRPIPNRPAALFSSNRFSFYQNADGGFISTGSNYGPRIADYDLN